MKEKTNTTDNEINGVLVNYQEPNTNIRDDKIRDYDTNEFVSFGSDNLFPQAIALMGRNSPNHRGVINSKVTYFLGNGLVSEDQQTEDWLQSVNFEGETLDEVQERLYLDDAMTGNAWLEIISDRNRSFLWFSQIDSTKCRLSRDKTKVIIHPDWPNYEGKADKKRRELPIYPNFEYEKNELGVYVARSVFHVKDYEPEFTNYGIPLWIAGKDSVEIDLKTNRWNLARLKNSFRVSGILVVPVKDKAESEAVIQRVKSSHIGDGKNSKLMVLTKGRAREGEKADTTQLIETKQDDNGSWMDLHKQSLSDVIVSHGWFRSLTGIADNTGFDTQRILNEYSVALNTVIKKKQRKWIEIYKKIFREQRNIDIDLKFQNSAPINDDNHMFIWEAREKKGLDSDPNDPKQQGIILKDGTVIQETNGQINNPG